MKRTLLACVSSLWAFSVQAQSSGTPPPPPTIQAPTSSPSSPGSQPPQRGSIAPIVDIRIQGEGISLPKGVGEAPPPEKPPAK